MTLYLPSCWLCELWFCVPCCWLFWFCVPDWVELWGEVLLPVELEGEGELELLEGDVLDWDAALPLLS